MPLDLLSTLPVHIKPGLFIVPLSTPGGHRGSFTLKWHEPLQTGMFDLLIIRALESMPVLNLM